MRSGSRHWCRQLTTDRNHSASKLRVLFSIQSSVVDIVDGGGDGACRHDVAGEDGGLGGREVGRGEGKGGGGGWTGRGSQVTARRLRGRTAGGLVPTVASVSRISLYGVCFKPVCSSL